MNVTEFQRLLDEAGQTADGVLAAGEGILKKLEAAAATDLKAIEVDVASEVATITKFVDALKAAHAAPTAPAAVAAEPAVAEPDAEPAAEPVQAEPAHEPAAEPEAEEPPAATESADATAESKTDASASE